MPTVVLPTPEEFSFDECLRYLGRSTQECLHTVDKSSVTKVIQCNGTPVFLRVYTTKPTTITIDYQADLTPEVLAPQVIAYVSDWFDLPTDLRPFYTLARQDLALSAAVERHYGLRMIGIADLFEALCWAIIGQQINLAFAYTLKQRFVQTFGTHHRYEDHPYYQFPTAEIIATLSAQQLTQLQFSARKAEYIIGIAQAIISGALSKALLLNLADDEAREVLMEYRGVGTWTANYVLLKCLKRPDAFPAKDVGLHNALKQSLDLSCKPTLPEVSQYAQSWRGWRGYATFYLWQTLLPKTEAQD